MKIPKREFYLANLANPKYHSYESWSRIHKYFNIHIANWNIDGSEIPLRQALDTYEQMYEIQI